MKIAVTYDKGNVFQHFGKTEQFKVYTVEGGRIQSAEVIGTDGAGHEALADVLAKAGIDTVICGGLGEGAQAALAGAGIAVCSGAKGNTDEAVEMFLAGELKSSGANCDHHDHEKAHHEHHHHEDVDLGCHHDDCGCHHEEEEESCGHDCGCCGGGCHMPPIEGPNAGKTCTVHYLGTFNDGSKFDSSYDRNEPITFICGMGMMIRGFDEAVAKMNVGETIDIHLMPEEAYGPIDPNAIFTVDTSVLPGSEGLEVGQQVYLTNTAGQEFLVTVVKKEGTSITFDANNPMAGKELNFKIELVEVKD